MRQDVITGVSMDRATAALLALLADRETDGNRSLVARRAVREYAERRGVKLEAQPMTAQERAQGVAA